MSNFRYFQNGGSPKWWSELKNWKCSEYGHLIYHLKAFFKLTENPLRTKALKYIVNKLLVIVSLVFHLSTLKTKIEKFEINP